MLQVLDPYQQQQTNLTENVALHCIEWSVWVGGWGGDSEWVRILSSIQIIDPASASVKLLREINVLVLSEKTYVCPSTV